MAEIHIDITGDNKQLVQSIQETVRNLQELKNKAKDTDGSFNMSKAKKEMKDVEKTAKDASKGVAASVESMASRYLTLAAAAGVAAKVLGDVVAVSKEFERKNSELASVLGTTKDNVQDLAKEAEQLGRITEFTATEVTELQVNLARLGFDKQQIVNMEEPILKFASAVGTDLGRASAFAGAALRGFGLESKDTTRLLDVMAASTSKSALDFSKLETSISIVAPIAHSFGLSVEDTVTFLGALSNAGFDASSAATALRNILLNLANSNGKLAKGLGHTAKTFPEIVAALHECTEKGIDLNDALQMTDLRSVSAFSALMSGAKSVDELRIALGNADGTLNDMYDTMTNNLEGSIRNLNSAWEGLMLSFKDGTGPMKDVVDWITKMINKLTDFKVAAEIGGKTAKDKEKDKALLDKYKEIGDKQGRDAMLAAYAIDKAAADKAYQKDLDDISLYGGNKSGYSIRQKRLAKKRAKITGDVAIQYSDIWSAVQNYLKPDDNKTTNPDPTKGDPTKELTDEQKKAIERAKKALEQAQRSLYNEVSKSAVASMKDGIEKELKAIDSEEDLAIRAIEEAKKKIQEAATAAGKPVDKQTYKQLAEWEANVRKEADNKRAVVNAKKDDSQNAYLMQYGDYWEKRYAIQKEYQDKIDAATDEWQKKTLEKERDNKLAHVEDARIEYMKQYGDYFEKMAAIELQYKAMISNEGDEGKRAILYKEQANALNKLNKEYSSTYSLIFANASSLSKNLLAEAIAATQEEIKKATQSGDIKELAELYDRLTEQMTEMDERNRGWGFSGIGDGLSLLKEAKRKRELASLFNTMDNDDSGIDWKKEAKDLFDSSLVDEQNGFSAISKSVDEIGDAFTKLGGNLEQFDGALGDIGKTMSAIGSQAGTIGEALFGKMDKSAAIGAVVSGAIDLMGMVFTSIQNNKKAQEEWNLTIEESAHKLSMLKLEAFDYKEQNLFGIENPYKKALDGAVQYTEAMKALNTQVAKLESGQVQTGTRKAVDWGNVGKGTAIGAAAGAAAGAGIFSGITAAVGAAIGAGIGLLVGLFSTKVEPVFESLSKKYGQLFDPETYELNQELIADYEKLDDATKQIVDNWDEIVNKAKEAEQQMRDNFHELAGDIGNQLSDALVNAFKNGDLNGAIDDFHKKMTSTIEDIMSQLVFSATFGKMFDELEKKMFDSFGAGGDQDIVDDLIWMEKEYQSRLDQYNAAMSQVQTSLKNLGYNTFVGEESQQIATSGAFKTMSQDTAQELNGRFTALQISNDVISKCAEEGITYVISISNVVADNNSILSDIRNMHALEVGYLEDISKYAKVMLTYGDKLDKIQEHTSKL